MELIEMNFSEKIAKKIVEHILPNSTMQYMYDQNEGEYDFNLKYADLEAPLEVTMAANQKRLETIGAITSNNKGGQVVNAVKCSNSWCIRPLPNANINRIRTSIDSYISLIEAEGYIKFFSELDYVKSEAIKNILHDLKVENGHVYEDKNTEKQIFIELPGQWESVSADILNYAVEVEASKKDNRRKLAMHHHGNGHLFIYVDMDNFLLWKIIYDEMLPADSPQLPSEISHVWVAA